MTYILFLDDTREIPKWMIDDPREVIHAKSAHDFWNTLTTHGMPDHVAFDFYLNKSPVLSPDGDECARVLKRKAENPSALPDGFSYSVHSSDPDKIKVIRDILDPFINNAEHVVGYVQKSKYPNCY